MKLEAEDMPGGFRVTRIWPGGRRVTQAFPCAGGMRQEIIDRINSFEATPALKGKEREPMAERILEQLRRDGRILSYAEGRRLIGQGAVSVNQVQLTNPDVLVSPGDEIRVGKRKYIAGHPTPAPRAPEAERPEGTERVKCDFCYGHGGLPSGGGPPCPACAGEGWIWSQPPPIDWESRARAAEASAQSLEVQLKGSEERAKMLLEAKNHWADRARAAEEELERVRGAAKPPDCTLNMPRARIELHGLLGSAEDVPEILTEAARIAKALLASGEVRFRGTAHPTQGEPKGEGTCPSCSTPLSHAPGIGPYCPNKACDRIDDVGEGP